MSATVRPLTDTDMPEAWQIVRTAFGTFLGAPDPAQFWPDRNLVAGRYGAEHVASFGADADGALAGVNFATRWGSVAFFGPLSVWPRLQGRGYAKPLVKAASDQFDAWGVRHGGLCTFPHSPLHIALYGKFGFRPRFLTPLLSMPAQATADPGDWSRYGALDEDERGAAEAACRDLADMLFDGLDLTDEMRTVRARALGDTLLVWEGSRLAAFAVCHFGPASEAGQGSCYAKFAAARPGAGAAARFARLLDAWAALAAQAGMDSVTAGVNVAREEAYLQMVARGFRAGGILVTMHRPNEPAYSRPGMYVLDDWR